MVGDFPGGSRPLLETGCAVDNTTGGGPLRVGPHVGSQVLLSSLTPLDQAEGQRSDCG